MSKRCINLILCSTSLPIGGLLYITLRPTTYVALLLNDISAIGNIQNWFSAFELDFCKYYLPDLLWCFSLCCGLIAIFNPKTKGMLICATSSFLCGVVWELLQYTNILSGTFDFIDISMYLTAVTLAGLINIKG